MKKMQPKHPYKEAPEMNPEGLVVIGQPKADVVYADPAWDINQRGKYGAINHYDLMPLEDIKRMPVSSLCKENAACFLWIVGGPDGRKAGEEVMKAWGFRLVDDIVAIKFHLGLGVYSRHAYENCLVGIKGKMPVDYKGQPNWIIFPKQDHSHKPEEMYEVIERMYKNRIYFELFARQRHKHPDWYIWGNEAEGGSDIYIPGYPVPEYSDKVHFAKEGDLEAGFESDILTDADMEAERPSQEGGK